MQNESSVDVSPSPYGDEATPSTDGSATGVGPYAAWKSITKASPFDLFDAMLGQFSIGFSQVKLRMGYRDIRYYLGKTGPHSGGGCTGGGYMDNKLTFHDYQHTRCTPNIKTQ